MSSAKPQPQLLLLFSYAKEMQDVMQKTTIWPKKRFESAESHAKQ